MTDRPAVPTGLALAVVVLKRFAAGHSYEGGVNGTCYECPFATPPLERNGREAPWHTISNDPTEAYFRCSLPGRTSEVVWGEYAPCTEVEWANAALNGLGEPASAT